jgi:exosortase K
MVSRCAWIAAAVVAVALQSIARADGNGDLAWMLAPTAALAGWFTGVPFFPSPGGEYRNLEHGIAIGRSCAGVRFFTMVFVLGVFSTLHRLDCPWKRWLALAGVFVGAYLTTILANASRIAGAILLTRLGSGRGGQTAAGLHLAEGIAVFAAYLVIYSLVLRLAVTRSAR